MLRQAISSRWRTATALARWRPTRIPLLLPARPPVLLFVCGGNTIRSPMAEAIARAELERAGTPLRRIWLIGSAGLHATHGTPMAGSAAEALRALGVPVRSHRSRQLTVKLCRQSIAIYCMTRAQRSSVLQLAPELTDRAFCLDPHSDIPEPGAGREEHLLLAQRLRAHVRSRLYEQLVAAGIRGAVAIHPVSGA